VDLLAIGWALAGWMPSPRADCQLSTPMQTSIPATIKTACGRSKYLELAGRPGPWARLRLAWFVLIASLRDWPLPAEPDQD